MRRLNWHGWSMKQFKARNEQIKIRIVVSMCVREMVKG